MVTSAVNQTICSRVRPWTVAKSDAPAATRRVRILQRLMVAARTMACVE